MIKVMVCGLRLSICPFCTLPNRGLFDWYGLSEIKAWISFYYPWYSAECNFNSCAFRLSVINDFEFIFPEALQWRHNERNGVSNHRRHDCLLNCKFRHRSKNISKLRVTGLCEGSSPVTGEFPAQRASNAENVSIWWRHHGKLSTSLMKQ